MELIHKAKEIRSGWKNFIEKTDVTEEVALERSKICAVCPNAKKSILLALIKDELKEVEGFYCSECLCPLSAKIRSNDNNSKCPLNKW